MNDNLRLSTNWTLHNVANAAISERGPVYCERGIDLLIAEGRHEQLHPQDGTDDLKEVWEYQLNFYVLDCETPDSSKTTESMIALVGELKDGRPCKIMGVGYIGRDDLGQIEGTFFKPPQIEIAGAEDDLLDSDWREA